MKITPKEITVRELVESYQDDGEEGVTGYGGKLDIRPPYQREFIYKPKQRDAVIDTVMKGFPLNVMYWVDRGDGNFEVMDGQQRTISLAQYVDGDFSYNFGNGPQNFHNLTKDQQDRILDYPLFVYVCEGEDSDKLDWFKTINIAGERLSNQELRNAVYHGPWLSDAKRWFSRPGGPADKVSQNYVRVNTIRQDLLETALKWMVAKEGAASIEDYMATHQNDPNATALWSYFRQVIDWARSTFPENRRELTQVDWGKLYLEHGDTFPDGAALEKRVAELMADDEVTKKAGIYPYVLDGDRKHLNLRSFTNSQRREMYERQNKLCARGEYCRTVDNEDGTKEFKLSEMEADHITPWSKGGITDISNGQMLCLPCNRQKGAI